MGEKKNKQKTCFTPVVPPPPRPRLSIIQTGNPIVDGWEHDSPQQKSTNAIRLQRWPLDQVCLVDFFFFFLLSLKVVCIGNVNKSVEPSNKNMLVEHLWPTVTFSPDLTVTPQTCCCKASVAMATMTWTACRWSGFVQEGSEMKRKWRIKRAYERGRVRNQSGGGRKGERFSWFL